MALFRRFGLVAVVVVTVILVFRQGKGWCAGGGLLGDSWLFAISIGGLGGLLGLPLRLLRLSRRHDAVIVLGMLEIILGHHAVARGVGVTGELQVLFIDVRSRATNLNFGAARIIRAIGVEPTAASPAAATTATVVTVMTVLRPTTASA